MIERKEDYIKKSEYNVKSDKDSESGKPLGVNLFIPSTEILNEGPVKIQYGTRHYSIIIGIGKDHTAELLIEEDALKELRKISSNKIDSFKAKDMDYDEEPIGVFSKIRTFNETIAGRLTGPIFSSKDIDLPIY